MLASWHFALNTLAGRRGRMALLISAVAIACALIVSIACCTASVQGGMEEALRQLLGRSDVRIIHPFQGRFEDALVDEVLHWPGVQDATGRLIGSLTLIHADSRRDAETGALLRTTPSAIGITPANEQSFRELTMRTGRRLQADDEIIIDPRTAEELQASVGDVLRVQRFGPPIDLTIVGVFDRPALMAIQRPQVRIDRRVLAAASGHANMLTHIMIILDEGLDALAFSESFSDRLPEPLALEPAEYIKAGFDRRVAASRFGIIIASVLTFISASFLIVTGMTSSVTERQRDMAIARCIGAMRSQLFLSQIMIGLFFALSGAAIGIPLGIGLSGLLVWYFSDLLEMSLIVPALGVNLALIGSVSAGVLAALYPARMASSVSPLEALAVHAEPPRARGVIMFLLVAVGAIAAQLMLLSIDDRDAWFWSYVYVGLPLMLAGYFLLATPMLKVVSHTVAPVLNALLRLPAGLLRDSLLRQPYRNGFTAGTLMIGVAILVSTWSNGQALLNDWIGNIRFADGFAYRSIGISPEQQQAIAALPFVQSTCAIGYLPLTVVGEQVFGVTDLTPNSVVCFGFDPAVFFSMNNVEWVQGEPDHAIARLQQGDALIVEERFLLARGMSVGQHITLGNEQMNHSYEIVGVISSPGLDLVTQMFGIRSQYMEYALSGVFMDIATVRAHYRNSDVYMMQVNIEPNISDDEATAAIEAAAPGVRFFSGRSIMQTINLIAVSLLSVQSVIAFAALLLASIGVGNIILAGIHGRRYEFGVLRAIGGQRSLLSRLIFAEAALLALTGALVGTALGLHAAWISSMHNRELLGIRTSLHIPEIPIMIGWAAVILLALLAALPGVLSVLRPQPSALLALGRND